MVDISISPLTTLVPFYIGKPYIVTIHDLQHKYYPKYFSWRERIGRDYSFTKAAKYSTLIVCESEFVKRDLIHYYGIQPKKIRILPSPPPSYIKKIDIDVNLVRATQTKYNLPERFIFYPAQFWFHKNHLQLLRCLERIKYNYNKKINLVLVGAKQNNFFNVMEEIKRLNLTKQVFYLGYVPSEEIPFLYKLSTALVMPTLFESISMPIWEAFYLGVPVVSSNVCALPEQVGDAGLIFDPNDMNDMADKIYKVWTDEQLRKNLIQKGYERIKGLTLENYAKQWETILQEVAVK
jgi:glycosyltransferase involved in cell wall biosynthesis